MKGMKGKLLKKLKSIKPIGYLKQDSVILVNAADGFIETIFPKNLSFRTQTHFLSKESDKENDRENSIVYQEPETIDVAELMKDLEEEEMDIDDDDDGSGDKENIWPPLKQGKEPVGVKDNMENSNCFRQQQTPLSEIDGLSFRRPDLNSGTLFDPNLLAAFEQAVKEHTEMTEAERQARSEKENIERRKEEERTEHESIQRNSEESRIEKIEEEPPLKLRKIEEEEEVEENPLLSFEEKCPPGGNDSVILYTTTLKGIRKTYEDCNKIRFLLESFRIIFYERDVSMHKEFKEELWEVLERKEMPPKLFIKGRYIGGAEEVLGLHEEGKFKILFEGIPTDRSIGACEGCFGFRFVVCFNCNGSHRVIEDNGFSRNCEDCNENGLIICPLCC